MLCFRLSTKNGFLRRKVLNKSLKTINPHMNHLYFQPLSCYSSSNIPNQTQKSNQNKLSQIASSFAKESYRVLKEELLNINDHKKAGKTYAKLDKEKLEKLAKEKKNVAMNTEVTSVINVKPKLTFWQKMFEKTKKTPFYSKYKGYNDQFHKYAGQNPHFQKFVKMRENVSDKIEDLKESYETTQNPVVWKIRDYSDRMVAETDTSYALRKIGEFDPNFMVHDFLPEFKLNILPSILQAILSCDMEFINQTCIDNANKAIFGYTKARKSLEDNVECKLVNIIDTDFLNASLHNKRPVLNFSCVAEHLETVTKKAPKKGERPTYFVRNVYYMLSVSPERDCPIFGWKFVEVQMQQMHALKS